MSDVALFVLARDPRGAKSRLAPVLDERTRAELAEAMLGDVLEATSIARFARRVVVTESATLRAVAQDLGVETLDVPLADTNHAARAAFAAAGDQAALVLAADLPLLSPQDVDAVLSAARDAEVVIGPDRHGRGTNALLLSPPTRIAPAFGVDSLRVHGDRARAAGATIALVQVRGIATDLDDPDDLRLVKDDPALGSRTAAALGGGARLVRTGR